MHTRSCLVLTLLVMGMGCAGRPPSAPTPTERDPDADVAAMVRAGRHRELTFEPDLAPQRAAGERSNNDSGVRGHG